MAQTLLLSDLHLSSRTAEFNQLLIRHLPAWEKDYDALYLLGDIFEIWLGDDMLFPFARDIIGALARFAEKKPLYFMPGNRDFLIGATSLELAGAIRLEDPSLAFFYGVPYILTHGDILCTDDVAYQNFRRKTRKPSWQQKMLAKPRWQRRLLGSAMRLLSKRRGARIRNPQKTDATQEGLHTMKKQFSAYPEAPIIHGHTHKPEIHRENFTLGEKKYVYPRIVLPDWRIGVHGALQINDKQEIKYLYF